MDDTQLNSLRREPSPAFAARLQASLREHDGSPSKVEWSRLRSIAAPALIVLAIVGLLSVPAVRASAQSFLALFRVVNFVAVPVDENRLARLAAENLDPPHLIGEQLQVLEDPGPPTAVVSPEQAGAAAGFAVRTPAYLPTAVYPSGIAVKGPQHFQVTPNTERLRQVMDTLSINDLAIPRGLDGEIVDVRVPAGRRVALRPWRRTRRADSAGKVARRVAAEWARSPGAGRDWSSRARAATSRSA